MSDASFDPDGPKEAVGGCLEAYTVEAAARHWGKPLDSGVFPSSIQNGTGRGKSRDAFKGALSILL